MTQREPKNEDGRRLRAGLLVSVVVLVAGTTIAALGAVAGDRARRQLTALAVALDHS
jgi:hypothetical protein